MLNLLINKNLQCNQNYHHPEQMHVATCHMATPLLNDHLA